MSQGPKEAYMMLSQKEYTQKMMGCMFDLLGHLTTLEEPVTFSAAHDAAPAVEALKAFLVKRKIPEGEEVDFNWHQLITGELEETKEKSKIILPYREVDGSDPKRNKRTGKQKRW
jgi:hypothetical protein